MAEKEKKQEKIKGYFISPDERRFLLYILQNMYDEHVEEHGLKDSYDLEGAVIILEGANEVEATLEYALLWREGDE